MHVFPESPQLLNFIRLHTRNLENEMKTKPNCLCTVCIISFFRFLLKWDNFYRPPTCQLRVKKGLAALGHYVPLELPTALYDYLQKLYSSEGRLSTKTLVLFFVSFFSNLFFVLRHDFLTFFSGESIPPSCRHLLPVGFLRSTHLYIFMERNEKGPDADETLNFIYNYIQTSFNTPRKRK